MFTNPKIFNNVYDAVIWINENNIQVINIFGEDKRVQGYNVLYYDNTNQSPIKNETDNINLQTEIEKRFKSDVFIKNVCLSYRHDFVLLSEEEQKTIIFKCKEWMRAITNNFNYFKDI